MNFTKNPDWIDQFQYPYYNLAEVPDALFETINRDLSGVLSDHPVVSVVIAAWNEEVNILRCIGSLSRMQSSYPFEIIVVNNNSTDRTQETLDRLKVRSFVQPIQGCGPARQLGQEKARGKYILTADADVIYPHSWIDEMIGTLSKPGVVCVYGRYSFISEPGYPRWKLSFFEMMKDAISEYRHINRPYFNAYGMSMGYIREFGLKVGFITINRRGEDGQLCLDLMPYGKIRQVRAAKARVWTGVRTLKQDGNIFNALTTRLSKELKRFFYNLHSGLPEDQKKGDPQ